MKPATAIEFEFLTEKAVLDLLFISRTTLWRLRKKLNIPVYRIEGTKRVYYRKEDILKTINRF
ncbi:MAG: helix-turn-helix transcriptional regulator [Flavobacteriales bacterium]|jgi:predicted DNA-binding transcriptional regulator AlpA